MKTMRPIINLKVLVALLLVVTHFPNADTTISLDVNGSVNFIALTINHQNKEEGHFLKTSTAQEMYGKHLNFFFSFPEIPNREAMKGTKICYNAGGLGIKGHAYYILGIHFYFHWLRPKVVRKLEQPSKAVVANLLDLRDH